jgi:hypothetical protein
MGAAVDLRDAEEDEVDQFLGKRCFAGEIMVDAEKGFRACRGDLTPVQAV